jgi:hypothetical protein
VLVGAGALTGYILARLLGLHAGIVARRAADTMRQETIRAVNGSVAEVAFAGLDAIDANRAQLADGLSSCQPPG